VITVSVIVPVILPVMLVTSVIMQVKIEKSEDVQPPSSSS
jgi:hypothetical protein